MIQETLEITQIPLGVFTRISRIRRENLESLDTARTDGYQHRADNPGIIT